MDSLYLTSFKVYLFSKILDFIVHLHFQKLVSLSHKIVHQLEEFPQSHVLSDFAYLQAWRLHKLTGWPVPESVLPQFPSFQEKCFLLYLNGISSVSVSVIPFVLSLDTTEDTLDTARWLHLL